MDQANLHHSLVIFPEGVEPQSGVDGPVSQKGHKIGLVYRALVFWVADPR